MHAAITGWGKCLPPAVLTNADLSTILDTSDEWILSRTGISERRISHVPLEELAYVAAMRARGWTRRSRLVDKTLESYLHVGMIHLMFPRAVILESVRDPLDTCVACWRQLFNHGNETLYDLAEIGAAGS